MPSCSGTALAEKGRPLEMMIAVTASLFCAAAIVVVRDFPRAYQGALIGAFLGAACLVFIRRKRIWLVVAWILLRPLSIEKIFSFGKPLLPYFLPPTLVISVSDVVLFMLFMWVISDWIIRNRKSWFWPAAATPLMLLAVWTALNFLIQGHSADSLLAVMQIFKMFVFIMILCCCIRTKEEIKMVLLAVGAAIAIQSVIVITSYIIGRPITFASAVAGDLMTFEGSDGAQSHSRATGTVGHVNQQAAFHVFFTMPLMAFLAVKNRLLKLSACGVIILSLVALVLTFSRTAWLSTLVAFCAAFLFAYRKKLIGNRFWVMLFFGVCAGLTAMAFYYRPIIDRIVKGDEGATPFRMRMMDLSLDLSGAQPVLGVGPNNFSRATLDMFPPSRSETLWQGRTDKVRFRNYGRMEYNEITDTRSNKTVVIPIAVHNKYLLVLAELGLVGLFLFVWFQWRVYRHILVLLKSEDRMVLLTGIGLMGAFFATQVFMSLDLYADDKPMEILMFVPILAISAHRIFRHRVPQ